MSNDLKTMPNFTALMERATKEPLYLGTPTDVGILNPEYITAGEGGDRSTIAQVWGIPLHSSLDEVRDDPRWQEGLANAALLVLARNNVQALVEALVTQAAACACGFVCATCGANWELLAAIEEQARAGGEE